VQLLHIAIIIFSAIAEKNYIIKKLLA